MIKMMIRINSISDIRKIFDSMVSSEIKENDLPDGDLFRRKESLMKRKINGFIEMNILNQSF